MDLHHSFGKEPLFPVEAAAVFFDLLNYIFHEASLVLAEVLALLLYFLIV